MEDNDHSDTEENGVKEKLHSESPSLPPSTTELLVVPPDGGYGWVIIFASFLLLAIVEGCVSAFGVLLPEFLAEFKEGRGKTSIVGSLLPGCFLTSGIVASSLINKFGCRVVTMAGATLAATGFLLATCSPNVTVLCVTFGWMGGTGLGLMYLPAMVMAGYYFEKKRALATGIATSGAGFGLVLIAPLTAACVTGFDWKYAMVILGGIALQGCIMGALLRPLRATPVTASITEGSSTSVAEVEDLDDDSMDKDMRKDLVGINMQQNENYKGQENTNGDLSVPPQSHTNGVISPKTNDVSKDFDKPENVHESLLSPELVSSKVSNVNWTTSLPNMGMPTALKHEPMHPLEKSRLSFSHDMIPIMNQRRRQSQQEHCGKADFNLPSPLLTNYLFYSSSIQNLPYGKSQASLASAKENGQEKRGGSLSVDSTVVNGDKGCTFLEALKDLLSLALCKELPFDLILFVSFLIQLGYFIPPYYIVDHATSMGIHPTSASTFIAAIGLSNTVGRFAAGAFANLPRVSALHVNNISLVVAGGSAAAIPFCPTYGMLMVTCICYGFFSASFVPLSNMFLIKYLGIERLTNSFGLLSVVRGIASMAGPPLAGHVFDSTGSYSASFYMCGGFFASAGLLHYILPPLHKWQTKRRNRSTFQPESNSV